MKLLSSRSTPLTKFLLPGIFLAALPLWVLAATQREKTWITALVWVVVCVVLLWWTLPIKTVRLAQDRFRISNSLRTVEVPAAHLKSVDEDRNNRTPNLTLIFEPPTLFGPKIRILTPYAAFDEIAATLQEIVRRNRGAEPTAKERLSARTLELIAHPVLKNSAAIVELTEPELTT